MHKLEEAWADSSARPIRFQICPSGQIGGTILLEGGRWLVTRSVDADRPGRVWYHDLDAEFPTPISLIDGWVEPTSKYMAWCMATEIDGKAAITEFNLAVLWDAIGVLASGKSSICLQCALG